MRSTPHSLRSRAGLYWPQDRTAVETDKKEVARAISAFKPNAEQLDDLLNAQKAAEKQAMLDKMR